MISIITGIIAEFNPLHLGHQALVSQVKAEAEACIVILSSNFTQRGSPSFTDKFSRAKMALSAGADLVLELPFLFACSAGQDFARGAVSLASHFADSLAFGMETPEADVMRMLHAEDSQLYTQNLRHQLSLGASYPKAHSLALEAACPGAGEFVSQPNNLLALSYMREIVKGNYALDVMKVKREGDFRSKMIREDLAGNAHMMPEYTRRIIAESEVSDEERLWPLLQSVLIRSRGEDLRRIYGIDEGIEGLFLKHWKQARGLGDFIGRCVCARYTRAHIRRRLVYVLLGLVREDVRDALTEGVPYARVLGFNDRGRDILRMKREIRVITRLADAQGQTGKYFADTEYRASQLYELTLTHQDFARETQKPVIIHSIIHK
ncbi:MAG: nucleotidyltransferase family protein [Synergistaceae bacterium]|nr:nucleotidyltransferase family protein [Synergistaceae bacterium]